MNVASRRRAAWAISTAALVALLAFCAFAGWASGHPFLGWASLIFFIVVALLSAASQLQTVRRRRRRFEVELNGSLEVARARLDVDSLQSLRAIRGDAVTAREIQKQLPQLTIGQVAELLRSL